MSLTLIDAPAIEPVTLDALKARLRISDEAHDLRLAQLISTARERVERETGRALIAQTWLETRDGWEGDGRLAAFATQFKLLKPPLIALEALTTYAAEGTPLDHDPAAFFIDTVSEPGRLVLKPDSVFPVPGRPVNGIAIRFRCGYGEAVEDVPATLVEAVAQLAASLFEEGWRGTMPSGVAMLLAPWRRWSL